MYIDFFLHCYHCFFSLQQSTPYCPLAGGSFSPKELSFSILKVADLFVKSKFRSRSGITLLCEKEKGRSILWRCTWLLLTTTFKHICDGETRGREEVLWTVDYSLNAILVRSITPGFFSAMCTPQETTKPAMKEYSHNFEGKANCLK
jgi:hypothetical protein